MFTNKNSKSSDILQLIGLYKSHEILWNMNLPTYRRNDLKVKAYENISMESRLSVDDVKKKIKSLRTSYCAEKAKVDKSKKSGTDTESIYIPKLSWYNEMSFLDSSLHRRKTVDNSKEEDFFVSEDISFDSETFSDSFNEPPSTSKRRRIAPEHKSKLDDALDKLISLNNVASAFEAFGDSVAKQLNEFPEEEAYETMSDIQSLISRRKIELLRKKHSFNNIVPINHIVIPSRTSTPMSQTNSNSQSSNDLLYCAMSDAEIYGEG